MGVDGLDLGDPFDLSNDVSGDDMKVIVAPLVVAVTDVGAIWLSGSNAEEDGDSGGLHDE